VRPVLFDILGFPINSYGVSKALAALMAAYLLGASSDASDGTPSVPGTW